MTPKGQTRDPSTLRAKYLENSWKCYIATIATAVMQYGRLSYRQLGLLFGKDAR